MLTDQARAEVRLLLDDLVFRVGHDLGCQSLYDRILDILTDGLLARERGAHPLYEALPDGTVRMADAEKRIQEDFDRLVELRERVAKLEDEVEHQLGRWVVSEQRVAELKNALALVVAFFEGEGAWEPGTDPESIARAALRDPEATDA